MYTSFFFFWRQARNAISLHHRSRRLKPRDFCSMTICPSCVCVYSLCRHTSLAEPKFVPCCVDLRNHDTVEYRDCLILSWVCASSRRGMEGDVHMRWRCMVKNVTMCMCCKGRQKRTACMLHHRLHVCLHPRLPCEVPASIFFDTSCEDSC
jgi:hypothetical protein